MTSRVSTAGTLFQTLRYIRLGHLKMAQLTYSLNNQKKFRQLKFYGGDIRRIIDLNKVIEARRSYIQSIGIIKSTVDSYDAALTEMIETASQALKAMEPSSSHHGRFEKSTTVLANNFMAMFEENLNMKIGDRYIFAGKNFSTAPVTDLRVLTLYNSTDLASNGAAANVIETGDAVPEHTVDTGGTAKVESYHTSFAGAGTLDAKAHEVLKVTINDDQQPTEYTIPATEAAFQNMAEGLLRLKSAAQAGLNKDERKEFLDEARNVLETARAQLRGLLAGNAAVLARMKNTIETHESVIAISQDVLGDLTGTQDEAVAAQISTLDTQLRASYTAFAKQNQLSLADFLR